MTTLIIDGMMDGMMNGLMPSTDKQLDQMAEEEVRKANAKRLQAERTAAALTQFTGEAFLTQKFGGRTPSAYQATIFDWFLNGDGDAFVDAVAGSGKSTTLEMLASMIPNAERRSSLFVAFNAHIAKALNDRLRPYGVRAQTIHSVGKWAVKDYYNSRNISAAWDANTGDKLKNKYAEHSRAYIKANPPNGNDKKLVSDCLIKVVGMALVTLTDPDSKPALREMITHFDIDVVSEEYVLDAVPIILDWGVNGLPEQRFTDLMHPKDGISFDDMVYLPNVLPDFNTLPQFKYLFVDEAQDLNAAQRELVLKMRAPGGRIIFVGDVNQAIYGFSGADVRSVETIQQKTNALMLPLSVCYRCPASHIRLAQKIVPHIQAREGAIEGTVLHIGRDNVASAAKEGDLFLCRTTAPLVKACLEMITLGKQAKVRGKDIGEALARIVDNVEKLDEWGTIYKVSEEKSVNLNFDNFLEALKIYRNRAVSLLNDKKDTEMQIESLGDRCDCVDTIYSSCIDRGTIRTLEDLRVQITSIFVEQKAHPPIMLSSVHKAKGLEEKRVFILRPDLMPHPKAKPGWELDQEAHIEYIALTRSMDTLVFVHEDGVPEPEEEDSEPARKADISALADMPAPSQPEKPMAQSVASPPVQEPQCKQELAMRSVMLSGEVKMKVNYAYFFVPDGSSEEIVRAALVQARNPKRMAEFLAKGVVELDTSDVTFIWDGNAEFS